jgi:pimeloyl-ACP methyl ester carboxylesterase
MDSERPNHDDLPGEEIPRIRRGRGLRLSVDGPPEDPAPPLHDAEPADLRRGAGLRLSTEQTPAEKRDGGWLRLAHGPIRYRQAGEGSPLLLLHGWGASSRYWLGTLAAFEHTHTSYAIDLPGFGESPALAQPASIARLAEVAIACADALGLERFDLNGHSFGASVAAYLAAHWPGRVRRLALTSFGTYRGALERALLESARLPTELALQAAQPWLNLAQPLFSMWRPAATALMGSPPLSRIVAGWFMDRVPDDAGLLHDGVAELLRMDPRAHLACLASVGDPALAEALDQIRAPTLLIGGLRDRAVPRAAVEAAHALLPGSRLAWLEHCGHVPMIEQPEAYHQALREFLLDERR